jgi:hypothetical protein
MYVNYINGDWLQPDSPVHPMILSIQDIFGLLRFRIHSTRPVIRLPMIIIIMPIYLTITQSGIRMSVLSVKRYHNV